MMKRIALTGSLRWEDRVKIKDVIFDLKKRLNDKLEIVGGGFKNGCDIHIKKFCLEFGIEYYEMPPHDYQWNAHCIEPAYMLGKPYKSSNIYIRNEKYAKECELLILFQLKDDDSKFLQDLVERFSKKSKKVLIIN